MYLFLLRKETRNLSIPLTPHQDPTAFCYLLVLRGPLETAASSPGYPCLRSSFSMCHAAMFHRHPLPPAAGNKTTFLEWLAFMGRHARHTLGVLCCYSYNLRIAPLLGCPHAWDLLPPLSPSAPCHCPSPKPQLRQVQGTGNEPHKSKDLR